MSKGIIYGRVLALIAVGALAAPLLACNPAGTTPATPGGPTVPTVSPTALNADMQEAASDIGLVSSGISAAMQSLAASNVLSPADTSKVTAYVADVQAAAGSLTATSTATAGQSAVVQLEAALNGLVSTVNSSGVVSPTSDAGKALSAANILLPVIEMGVGIVQNAVTANAPAAIAAPNAAAVTLARQTLAGIGK